MIKNLSALCFLNLLGYYINRIIMPEKNIFQPIRIDIEPTIKCNINCIFCQSPSLKRNKQDINLAEFKKILDSMPSSIKIDIQGMGEPLLNNEIFDMIKYAKHKKKFVTITTNGTLLTEEVSKKIIDSGLDRLIISLDSADKKSYEKVRKGASYDKVITNISNFIRIRGQKKDPFVSIWMLGIKETIDSLGEMVKIAKHIKVDALILQRNLTTWGKSDWNKKINNLKLNSTDLQKIKMAICEAKKNKLLFFINKQYTLFKKDKIQKCAWPWGGTYVSSNGYIVPCCLISDPKVYNFGNIFTDEFRNIWNNEKYRKFRRNIKQNNIPICCKHCYENSTSK